MATTTLDSFDPPNRKLCAPLWHTGLLIGIFVVLAAGGALFQFHAQAGPGQVHAHSNMMPTYVVLIAMEWSLLFYVRKGLREGGVTVRECLGARWQNRREVMTGLIVAAMMWAVWMLIEFLWRRLSGASSAAPIDGLLPRGAGEILLWIGVSVSAGVCEEFVFRGYLQRQFAALTGNRWVALLLQAVVFGIGHGYQGLEACAKIAIFGLLAGLVAFWRGSLRPGMVAHSATDIIDGIFGL